MGRFALPLVFTTILFALITTFPAAAAAKDYAGMLRYPDVSADHITFVYDNDVWIADLNGGVATPLSSPAGQESNPKFSPDGSRIAFTANYDGNWDVYEMPLEGGSPERLTYGPYSDRMIDYSPDGRVMFTTYRDAKFPQGRLFYAGKDGAAPEALPPAYAYFASINDTGEWLAFAPWTRETRTWARYQGGMATDIWLFNLNTLESKRMTDHPGTDDMPMFHGKKVYYLSDAGPENRRNIWVYDTQSGSRSQVTHSTVYDIKWPSIGPNDIVFEQGYDLYLLDLASLRTSKIEVTIPGDHPTVRAEMVDVSGYGGPSFVSPNAKRFVGEFRGDIWTLPVEHGYKINLTRTDGVAERDPSWSPDGKWITYFSDETGEYQLYRRLSDGTGEPEQLTSGYKTYFYSPLWSPDSEKIAFTEKAGNLYVMDLEAGTTVKVDKDPWGGPVGGISWASDSNWLAYSVSDKDTSNSVIRLYSLEDDKWHQVTSHMYPSFNPTFDTSGDYLYFASHRSFRPSMSPIGEWGEHMFDDTEVIAFVPLRTDVDSPFAPENDMEEIKADEDSDEDDGTDDDMDSDEDAAAGESTAAAEDEAPDDEEAAAESTDEEAAADEATDDEKTEDEEDEILKIDFDGIEARTMLLPVGSGGFGGLEGGEKKLFYMSRGEGRGAATIKMYDLEDQEEKTIVDGAGGFMLTPDRKKMAVFARGQVFVVDPRPGAKLEKPVDQSNMLASIDPRHEWPQLVHDAWRIYRDFFYDPNMHGVNWDAQLDRAQKMVRHAANREDVTYIIGLMAAELNVGHAYVGGPGEGSGSIGVGVLGCDFEVTTDADGNRGVSISRIYTGADWDPDVRNPLLRPGIEVNEGDFLLAINGIPVDPDLDPYAAFAGLANQTVGLTVSSKAVKDDDAREILVDTMGDDFELRTRYWIEQNRQYVFEQSGGKIGYIYVRDTSWGGFVDFQRQFMGQYMMDGLIVDERWNGGGLSPHQMVETLARQPYQHWATRDGQPWRTPQTAHVGPKAMLINHAAGSGGDSFPWLFRHLNVGPLIGTRTWGGLVGLSGNPRLIDGGSNSVPRFAFFDADGTWAVEGHGVDPDIEVIDDPTLLAEGQDPQLDAAIEWVLGQLEASPPLKVAPLPPYPDRSGSGVPSRDW